MNASTRREFVRGAVTSMLLAGLPATALAQARKVKPTASDVLLVVDVQNCFVPGGTLPVKDGDQIVPLINRIAAAFQHVVLTQDWHTPGHASFASTYPGKKPFETAHRSSGRITASRARRTPTSTRISGSRTPS